MRFCIYISSGVLYLDKYIINGGKKLGGRLRVHGAKNAVLPIMAATVLSGDVCRVYDCPELSDVKNTINILNTLGCNVNFEDGILTVDSSEINNWEIPEDMMREMRSSIIFMGALAGKMGRARLCAPGGCELGNRPIDIHLKSLRELGVEIREENGFIEINCERMHPGDIHLSFPSVGATENVMMAAVGLHGTTLVHNAAREPEIVDLQNFLCAMGAKVSGAGTHTIAIEGVKRLHGVAYTPMPDRIVAGTLLAAAAATGGNVRLRNVPVQDLYAVFAKLREMGCIIDEEVDAVTLHAPERLRAFHQLQTQPHPGFPTDMQVQMLALAVRAQGTSVVVENVFENRFTHAGDLNRMGADVMVNGRTAIVKGVDRLYGARVAARDLRGGAALTIAGLQAEGETLVEHVELIDRGYDKLEQMLSALGADVCRTDT